MHRSDKNLFIFLLSFLVTGLLILAADRWAEGAESSPAETPATVAAPVQQSSGGIQQSDTPNIVKGFSTSLARHYQTGAPIAAAPVQHLVNNRPCKLAFTVCEKSCSERGGLYGFSCIAPEFQQFSNNMRCQCADQVR